MRPGNQKICGNGKERGGPEREEGMPGQKMEAIRMGVPAPGSPALDRGRIGKAALERKFDSDLSLAKGSTCFAPGFPLVPKLLSSA